MMMRFLIVFCCFLLFGGCRPSDGNTGKPNLLQGPWPQIEAQSRNTTVNIMMWQGDPLINRYMTEWVAPEVKNRFGITLNIAPGQGNEVVKILLSEKDAGMKEGRIDMCWINGETFFQLRQIDALYGPFSSNLPNSVLIDFANPFIGTDFQQPVNGYECPWGNVQMCMVYDTVRTPAPPRTMVELEAYLKAHPGKFTIPYEFTGMTLLKSWLIALAGGGNALDGPFDEQKYQKYSGQLWDFINRNKANFWRNGQTFPSGLAAMHQMFANGELDFTMSNNDGEVDNKILQRIFPGTTKSFVFQSGTIQNTHYWGIPASAPNKAGAMTVINFLVSPEAQLHKLNPAVWGDGTVLNLQKLPDDTRRQFEQIPERKNAPPRSTIQPFALKEPAPEYMIRLFEDFRKKVIGQ